ncbi:2OG-Fe(II) oxygenase superfamily protein [Stagonosporopsis vannaccii]|nr:2OG-Fe(II) oxygenase superfamily protein [Stagonosporopsis vannaccii]
MAHVVDACDNDSATGVSLDLSSELPHKRRRTEKSRVGAAYPRKRAVTACRLCRARKVKCDNARPSCGGCVSTGSPCIYHDSQDHSAFDPASILILDRLDQVLAKLEHGPAFPTISTLTGFTPDQDAVPDESAAAGRNLAEGEAGCNQLRIPTSQTTPDAILSWPVFQHRWAASFTTDPVFEAEFSDGESAWAPSRTTISSQIDGYNEENIPGLVQKFLRYVHIKNPIVDAETITMCARNVSVEGLKWDASSCMVALACALGCVATPFPDRMSNSKSTSLQYDDSSLRTSEAYYNCARKRFGLLKASIPATQCHFLAGVYLMYTMRPLSAWSHFRSASTSYHLYLDFQARRQVRNGLETASLKQRSLEQSLYWSCYKSECELRIEMNLPDSCLADIQYPDLHPFPPCTDTTSSAAEQPDTGNKLSPSSTMTLDKQQEENSWFYYLTEITLRRIWNSVLNTLYSADYRRWTDKHIPFMARAAIEFEQQLQQWYNGLPPSLQYQNPEMQIRFEELPWLTRAREHEIRVQVYQPFLYFAIHQLCSSSCGSTVLPLAEKALYYCFSVIEAFPARHRHHGTWYGIRFNISASFLILAAVKSQKLVVRSDWHCLMVSNVDRLAYWKDEAPGLSEAIEVIEYYL